MHGHGLEVLRHDDPSVLGFDARGLDRIVSTLWAWHLAGDAGMQLAVYRSGTLVLAVACGRDPFTGRPIRHDTLFCLLSTTKALAALAMLHLRSNGCFDWEDQIVDYWPAFGQGGKQAATIEHLMCHRIGIPRVTAPWQRWIDRSHMARLIETSHVEWDPGTRYGYHGGSFGFIVDELCRRLAGRTAGQILHEIAVKVGHPDCYIGLPQPYMKRVAKLQFLEPDQRPTAGEGNPHPPFGANGWYNNERVLASCQPSGGGVASAVALAGVLNLVAGWGCYRGYRAWAAAEQMEASRVRSPRGEERPASASLEGGSWGLGFLVTPTPTVFGTAAPGPLTMGHAGASGSVAYADPTVELSMAFTINGVRGRRQFLRYRILGDLLQQAIGRSAL